MLLPRHWRSATAFTLMLLASSTATVPLLLAKSIAATPTPFLTAQRLPDSWRVSAVPSGTQIPVRYDEAEKIVLLPDETVPVTLTVNEDIVSTRGRILIPAGSQISGELEPAGGGTQFVAETVTLYQGEQPVTINATSEVITTTETISRRSDPNILRGAAIGAGAAAVLSEILGRIDWWEVLGGAGVGVLAEVLLRGKEETEVVVVEPETDLVLTLNSDFAVNSMQR